VAIRDLVQLALRRPRSRRVATVVGEELAPLKFSLAHGQEQGSRDKTL
jgi:hypothetical protein